MTAATVPLHDEFVMVQCNGCGCFFFIPAGRYEWYRRYKSHPVHCPNGHSTVISKPDEEYRYKKEAAQTIVIRAMMIAPPVSGFRKGRV